MKHKHILSLITAVILICSLCVAPLVFAADTTVKIGDQDIKYTQDTAGMITTSPTEDQVKKLIDASQTGDVIFDFSGQKGVTGITFEIDPEWFIEKEYSFTLKTPGYSLNAPFGLLEVLSNTFPGKVQVVLKQNGVSVSIAQDGKEIDWYSYRYPVTVKMAQESGSDHAVMRNTATQDILPRSWYNDGAMTVKIYKSGTYDVSTAKLATFSDTEGKPINDAITFMQARGIVNGKGDGLFDPEGNVTRAEFMTMIMRTINPEPQGSWMVLQFSDIPENAYYWDIALKAKAMGFVSGVGDNKLNPNGSITHQEMITMVYKAMDNSKMLPEVMTAEFLTFDDWDSVAEYAHIPVQTLAKLKIIESGGNFEPKANATRAEAAQVLCNMLKYDLK